MRSSCSKLLLLQSRSAVLRLSRGLSSSASSSGASGVQLSLSSALQGWSRVISRTYYTKPVEGSDSPPDESLAPWRTSQAEYGLIKDEDGKTRVKLTTNMPQLPVVENAREVLLSLYDKLLVELEEFPEDDYYRASVTSVINFFRSVVIANEDIEKIEEIIGMGQIEELIQQAEDEFDALDALWELRKDKDGPETEIGVMWHEDLEAHAERLRKGRAAAAAAAAPPPPPPPPPPKPAAAPPK